MPLRDFRCGSCGWTQERYFHSSGAYPGCERCGGILDVLPLSFAVQGKTAAFPFDCPHVTGDGRPLRVESLGHLRQIERRYGVVFSAFSQNPSNPADIKDPPRYRGFNPYRPDRPCPEAD